MINIERNEPAPLCLAIEKQKENGNYRCGDVVARLQRIFLNKCYICEFKAPPSINVEHFLPHKGDRELMFDWNNLFFACDHCNRLKSDGYTPILKCTDPTPQVDKVLNHSIEFGIETKVEVRPLKTDDPVTNTARLLNAVYNGTTVSSRIEAANIREYMAKDIVPFTGYLLGYMDCNSEQEKQSYRYLIEQHLRRDSAFCAFKRWLVRRNPRLAAAFPEVLGNQIKE